MTTFISLYYKYYMYIYNVYYIIHIIIIMRFTQIFQMKYGRIDLENAYHILLNILI